MFSNEKSLTTKVVDQLKGFQNIYMDNNFLLPKVKKIVKLQDIYKDYAQGLVQDGK